MSYMKHYFHDQIVVSGDIENRNFDDLYGVILIQPDGVQVYIDDFIEHNDGGLSVCFIVTAANGTESYGIMPARYFIAAYVCIGSSVIYPASA